MRHLSTDFRRESCVDHHLSRPTCRRARHPHLPPLYYAVRNRDWDAVRRRLRAHSREVWVQEESSGNTSLHVACRLDPPASVVAALLTVGEYSETGMDVGSLAGHARTRYALEEVRNAEGATALHVACSHRANEEVIRILMAPAGEDETEMGSGNREWIARTTAAHTALTRMGRSPLHYACMSFRGLGVEAFRALLEATVLQHAVAVAAAASASATAGGGGGYDADLEAAEKDDDCALVSPSIDCKFEFNKLPAADLDDEDDEDAFLNEHDAPISAGTSSSVANPVTLRDVTGQTPLGLLFRRYRERLRCVIKIVEKNAAASSGANDILMSADGVQNVAAQAVQADLGELWEKARLIVSTMAEQQYSPEVEDMVHFNGTFPWDQRDSDDEQPVQLPSEAERFAAEEAAAWAASTHRPLSCRRVSPSPSAERIRSGRKMRSFRIVHASVGLVGYGCPPEMVRLAASVHPEQVREMDEDGNLPLHIAATASSFACADADDLAHHHDECKEGGDELSVASTGEASLAPSTMTAATTATATTFGSFCAPCLRPFDSTIRILLRHYPEAARIPHGRTGRLPLVLAIDAGRRTRDDGMQALLCAYPPAMYNRDYVCSNAICCSVYSLIGTERADEDQLMGRPPGSFMAKFRSCANSKGSSSKALGTLFELVRARPQIVGGRL